MPTRDLKAPSPTLTPINEPTNVAGSASTTIINVKIAVPNKAPLAVTQSIVSADVSGFAEVASTE